MRRSHRIFLSLYLGFFVYCLATLFFGRTGIVATQDLLRYKADLERNLASLESLNSHLGSELVSLQSDPGTIRLEARQLGYYPSNALPVHVEGYAPAENLYAVGSLVVERRHVYPSDRLFRLLGVGSALLCYLLTGFLFRNRDGYQQR